MIMLNQFVDADNEILMVIGGKTYGDKWGKCGSRNEVRHNKTNLDHLSRGVSK